MVLSEAKDTRCERSEQSTSAKQMHDFAKRKHGTGHGIARAKAIKHILDRELTRSSITGWKQH